MTTTASTASENNSFWWLRPNPSTAATDVDPSFKQVPPGGGFRTSYDLLSSSNEKGQQKAGSPETERTVTTHEFKVNTTTATNPTVLYRNSSLSSSSTSSSKAKCRTRTRCQKCALISFFCGIVFILAAVICAFIMRPIVENQILNNLPLRDGGQVFQGWKDPPVQPIMYIYVFNLTNKEDFLEGKAKPKLQELGPYSYHQDMRKVNVNFSSDGRQVDYMQSRVYYFAPELSQGNAADDVIVVPNVPLFGAFKALKPEPEIAKSIFLTLVDSYNDIAIDTQPFVTVTVHQFLWGYPSSLLSLDRVQNNPNCVVGSDDGDEWSDFGSDDAMDDFDDFFYEDIEGNEEEAEVSPAAAADQSQKKNEKINCDIIEGNLAQFGLFLGRNNSVLDLRTIKTGVDDLGEKGVMVRWHGKETVDYWRDTNETQCNRVEGRDPGGWPININTDTTLNAFVGPLCRKLVFSYHKNVNVGQFEALQFVPDPRSFDNPTDRPENQCYCLSDECLPSGLFDIEGCQKGSPIALSWPHFLHGDPNLLEGIEGLNPNPDHHSLIFNIEPKYGVTLTALIKLQMSVTIERGDGYGFFDKISQSKIHFPFLWLSEGIPEPSQEMADQVEFLLSLPEMVKQLMAICTMSFGLVLLLPELIGWLARSCSSCSKKKEAYIQSSVTTASAADCQDDNVITK